MGMKRSAIICLISLVACCLGCPACSDDDSAGSDGGMDGDTDSDSDSDSDGDSDSDADGDSEVPCPDVLSPIDPWGQVETVGDGSAASCTEANLRTALDAISAADGGGTVLFDCGAEVTITLSEGLFVDFPLMIDGGGAVTLSGGEAVRVIELDHYTDLTVQRLTIADGRAEDSGAGILHPWYGTLTAIQVAFENNRCTSQEGEIGGGAVFAGGLSSAIFSGCSFTGNEASNGGGILNRGTNLTVVDTVFRENRATSSADSGQFGNGGGLYIDGMNYDEPEDFVMCGAFFESNSANQHGSAVFSYFYDDSQARVDSCVFDSNNFDGSPTGGAGGYYHQVNQLTMKRCTFSNNTSEQHAAGLFVGSGETSGAYVENCTFADNVVPEVGAAVFSGAAPVDLVSCTFHGNDADYGPAIFKGEDAEISITSCIFADNTTPNEYSALACHESLIDGGGNLQWPETKNNSNPDTPCAEGITFADPLLGELTDNGGFTETMAIPANSPAVDAADDCPETDQRGVERYGACDIGAYEYNPES